MNERQEEDEDLREVAQAAEAVVLIENAPLPLVVIFPDARIAFANRAFCDLLGYPPAELAGVNIRDILADESDFERRWEAVVTAEGVTPDRIGHLKRLDGARVDAHIATLVVTTPDGAPRYVVARALLSAREG